MKAIIKIILLVMLVVGMLPTRAGLMTTAGREALERIASTVVKESTESAARKTAKELLEKAARTLPEIADYVRKYGDDAFRLVENPRRVKICSELGDDGAEALVKHGYAAEEVLEKIQSSKVVQSSKVACLLSKRSKSEVREFAALAKRGKANPAKENEFWGYVSRYPRASLAAAATATGFIVDSMNGGGWFDMVKAVVKAAIEHPVATCCLVGGFVLLVYGLWWYLRTRLIRLFKSLAKRLVGAK